jgi:hypothetical protein
MGLLLATLFPMITAAQSTWLEDPALQRRLADGEIIVRTAFDAHERKGACMQRCVSARQRMSSGT